MFETLDKLMLAGIGAMTMTREKAEELFDDYVQKGKATRDQRTGFVRDLMDQAEKARQEMEKMISEQVHKSIDQLYLATKDDVRELSDKITQLSIQISAMKLPQ